MQLDHKLLYSEIVQGYSPLLFDGKIYYIKHFNTLDISLIDIERQKYMTFFTQKGLPTYKEKLQELIKDKLWSDQKEAEIKEYRDFIINLEHSKKQYVTKKDKKLIQTEIESYNDKLHNLLIEKAKLIGKTADQETDKKINEFYIYISLYQNSLFSQRFYTIDEFNDLEEEEVQTLIHEYNKKISVFSERNLKKVSLMPQFFNLFALSGDNIYNLFGKPFVTLSFYQIEIIQHAQNYKNILNKSEIPPPPEILQDYDKLEEWFNTTSNTQKLIKDNLQNNNDMTEIGGGSIVGMSKEELKQANIDTTGSEKVTQALKNKSELTMDDILKLEGLK